MDNSNFCRMDIDKTNFDTDDLLVDLVKDAEVIWRRNHPHFKSLQIKEQAWRNVASKLGISSADAERRFKSIREKYRRRKILLEKEQANNVQNTKLSSWSIYSKLGFLDDYMIPRNSHNQSMGELMSLPYYKSDSSSNETNNSSEKKHIQKVTTVYSPDPTPIPNPTHDKIGNLLIKAVSSLTAPAPIYQANNSSSSGNNNLDTRSIVSSTGPSSPSNTNYTNVYDSDHFEVPEVKMEVPDDGPDEKGHDEDMNHDKNLSHLTNDWKYVGDFISNELNKLPPRKACALKNILIREVLKFSENYLLENDSQ